MSNNNVPSKILSPPPMVSKRIIDLVNQIEAAKIVLQRRGPLVLGFDPKRIKKIVGERMNEIQGNRTMTGTAVTWKDLHSLLSNTCKDLIEDLKPLYEDAGAGGTA